MNEAELIGVLPAFTLETDTPIIIILNIIAELANQKPLHFYPMKGAEVTGAGYQFVRIAANPDTTEDTSAVFFDSDGKTKITTLDAKNIYVAAAFSKGSYAPLVMTGTAKNESKGEEDEGQEDEGNNEGEETADDILGSSSGGCNSGAFISGALTLATLMFVKSKR
ncbi:MAG: hypothetical protein II917_06105 [Synergistaceae bacterium]|nr:hypothetical protein [Synergistaceae bacterium]